MVQTEVDSMQRIPKRAIQCTRRICKKKKKKKKKEWRSKINVEKETCLTPRVVHISNPQEYRELQALAYPAENVVGYVLRLSDGKGKTLPCN